jgi:Ser/Thr protein kinase RdoA (MazF antagonist)
MQSSEHESIARYAPVAEAALRCYPVGHAQMHFIGHNAGVVYRVDAPDKGETFLLKLHDRAGEGYRPSAAALEQGMQWLAGVSRHTPITVQTPIATTAGPFVCTIALDGASPIHCTLHRWLEGRLPNGPFSEEDMRHIGAMMATLHQYSRRTAAYYDSSVQHGAQALREHTQVLRAALPLEVLSHDDYALVEAAVQQISAVMQRLGYAPEVWGPVHGDLHYDNILLFGDEVRPIDFSELRLAHYLYDVGVTFYHTLHQGPALRRAFLAAYQPVTPLPADHGRAIEAFITYAAIDNLAWNASLQEQVASPLFRKNLRQLVKTFCGSLADGVPFLDDEDRHT